VVDPQAERRTSARFGVALLAVLLSSTGARAEPWYAGKRGHHRLLHLSITIGAGAVYGTSELLKPQLAPSQCRWCDPPSFDVSVRDALKWHDTSLAAGLSNIDGFAVAPLFALGITAFGATDDGAGAIVDDTVPIFEAAILGQLVVQATKFSVGRARPFVHFDQPPPDADDNVSFFSGHTSFTFALATGAGLIAHRRHARLEPLVWGGGFALAAAAGYLRIAADKHYATDVITGAVVGTATGLCVPFLAGHDIDVVPTGTGVALVGSY
jgi:membrane-associated phospholipid phosphatase